ncbi:pepsin-like aspartic protease [Aspergillus alliaceus]|uniref:pepsin-like aspartic protease n=1 Tax=Petromyces alliaceus TaxID=209559 RepID=UPI0012A6FE30|nr:aspartic peptidase domain-containing protein [Aspergillus alliaceus]KAB8238760.1 aspartic peptidase domain-containing protein [Aspergillus alliaceus]
MKSFPGVALLVGLPLCLVQAAPESTPLSFEPGVDWYGNDGTWSAVNVWVGTDLTTVSLFPSTVDRNTWLIGGKGCENSSLSDCSKKRGGLFRTNESSTWFSQGQRPSSRDSSIQANYGTDTIVAYFTEIYENQLAVVNDTDTWIGLLGLAVGSSDHADLSTFSLMEQAYLNTSISPSGTYGYTAGAHYRLKGVPASLTIGGVDQERYSANNATFHLTRSLTPVVSLNTISISSGTEGDDKGTLTNHQITPSQPGGNALYTLDSSTSYIWLPGNAFDAFGQAFNLTYDDDLGFYTYGNDTSLRQRLLSMDLSITFSISDFPDASQSVNITLPFQAFDHSLTYPFPNLPSKYSKSSLPYIPIKRTSTNEKQRIGRVFFQEAYLAVDYEKKQFSLYQAKFDENLLSDDSKDIVRIDSYLDKSFDELFGKKGLSTAAKVGIGVGTAVGAILVIGAGVFVFLRKRRSVSEKKSTRLEDTASSFGSPSHGPGELYGDGEHRYEMASDTSHAVFELPGSGPAELDAGPSFISYADYVAGRDEKRHSSRHSETRSSIAVSLSSKVTESSDEEDGPAPKKGHTDGPPKYTP